MEPSSIPLQTFKVPLTVPLMKPFKNPTPQNPKPGEPTEYQVWSRIVEALYEAQSAGSFGSFLG